MPPGTARIKLSDTEGSNIVWRDSHFIDILTFNILNAMGSVILSWIFIAMGSTSRNIAQ